MFGILSAQVVGSDDLKMVHFWGGLNNSNRMYDDSK